MIDLNALHLFYIPLLLLEVQNGQCFFTAQWEPFIGPFAISKFVPKETLDLATVCWGDDKKEVAKNTVL